MGGGRAGRSRGPALPLTLSLGVEDARAFAAVVRGHGFTPDELEPLQSLERNRGLTGYPALVERACGERGPLGVLAKLFVFDGVVAAAEAAEVLAPLIVDDLVTAGLLVRDGDAVRGTVRLTAFADHLLVTDRPARYGEPQYVLQLTPSAITLASAIAVPDGGTVLDLACGAGFHAVQAGRGGASVTASDLNPRAAMFVGLNAALNGVDVDVRQGDLWSAVAGERFDLVVANAPFIISPDDDRMFLTTEMELDDFCRTLAGTVEEHLTDSGVCQFMAAWPVIADEDADARVLSWFDGFAGDVWVMEFTRVGVLDHAAAYIDAATDPVAELQRWLDHFAHHRVREVTQGLVTMRRDEHSRLRAVTVEPTEADAPFTAALWTAFEARRRVAGEAPGWLLGQVLAVTDSTYAVSEMRITDGHVERVQIQQRAGFHHQITTHPAVVQLLAACDGSRTLHDAIGTVASAQRLVVDSVTTSLTEIAEQCLYAGMLRLGRA